MLFRSTASIENEEESVNVTDENESIKSAATEETEPIQTTDVIEETQNISDDTAEVTEETPTGEAQEVPVAEEPVIEEAMAGTVETTDEIEADENNEPIEETVQDTQPGIIPDMSYMAHTILEQPEQFNSADLEISVPKTRGAVKINTNSIDEIKEFFHINDEIHDVVYLHGNLQSFKAGSQEYYISGEYDPDIEASGWTNASIRCSEFDSNWNQLYESVTYFTEDGYFKSTEVQSNKYDEQNRLVGYEMSITDYNGNILYKETENRNYDTMIMQSEIFYPDGVYQVTTSKHYDDFMGAFSSKIMTKYDSVERNNILQQEELLCNGEDKYEVTMRKGYMTVVPNGKAFIDDDARNIHIIIDNILGETNTIS